MSATPRILFLLLPVVALPAQDPAPKPDCAALEAEFGEAQKEWNRSISEANRAGDAEALRELRKERPEAAFVPRFRDAARLLAGTDDAVPFLVWLVSRGDSDVALESMLALMERHVEHPGIGRAVARIGGLRHVFGAESSRKWLDRVLDHNPDAAVQAQAHYTRAAMYVGTRAAERSEQLRKMAIADLQAVLANEGSQSLNRLATGLLFEAENLEPGLPAPDIEGEDLDGTSFKLSDYRGKVVLLDFWGDW